jgi:hypothetical protein
MVYFFELQNQEIIKVGSSLDSLIFIASTNISLFYMHIWSRDSQYSEESMVWANKVLWYDFWQGQELLLLHNV